MPLFPFDKHELGNDQRDYQYEDHFRVHLFVALVLLMQLLVFQSITNDNNSIDSVGVF